MAQLKRVNQALDRLMEGLLELRGRASQHSHVQPPDDVLEALRAEVRQLIEQAEKDAEDRRSRRWRVAFFKGLLHLVRRWSARLGRSSGAEVYVILQTLREAVLDHLDRFEGEDLCEAGLAWLSSEGSTRSTVYMYDNVDRDRMERNLERVFYAALDNERTEAAVKMADQLSEIGMEEWYVHLIEALVRSGNLFTAYSRFQAIASAYSNNAEMLLKLQKAWERLHLGEYIPPWRGRRLTVGQAARMLGMSIKQVERLVKKGILPAERLQQGGWRRIPESAVLNFKRFGTAGFPSDRPW